MYNAKWFGFTAAGAAKLVFVHFDGSEKWWRKNIFFFSIYLEQTTLCNNNKITFAFPLEKGWGRQIESNRIYFKIYKDAFLHISSIIYQSPKPIIISRKPIPMTRTSENSMGWGLIVGRQHKVPYQL